MILKECGKKLNISSIQEIENVLNVQFPKDYVNFMLEHNGGRPIEHYSLSFKETDPETHQLMDNSFDIHSFNTLEDMPLFYENLVSSEVIPKNYYSIADDSCGNEILLCLDGSLHHQQIFFGNHELYHSDES
ncbi:hypothetical protein H8356DRAFT_1672957 [Neocallimastix lanati (nom. inval.)]|nr:hypothetical protein H8356DRAFT_1672957 [Neocallimastix sp. JGI-2020a]